MPVLPSEEPSQDIIRRGIVARLFLFIYDVYFGDIRIIDICTTIDSFVERHYIQI